MHLVTLVFLQGLFGYVWVNMLTLSPQRASVLKISGIHKILGEILKFWVFTYLCLHPQSTWRKYLDHHDGDDDENNYDDDNNGDDNNDTSIVTTSTVRVNCFYRILHVH